MERDLMKSLVEWKTDEYRKPLLIRGARQVGKSWLVREFSKLFENFVEINFEKTKSFHHFFAGDLNIEFILEKLALHTGTKIKEGQTLLFLDEIQVCEGAIKALRYFKEENPLLHVIAAGSLLDFALEKIGLPVGRVQFLYLYPMSFGEYLNSLNLNNWRLAIRKKNIDETMHKNLLEHLKNYMWLGGMPEVIFAWIKDKDPSKCQKIQDEIIDSYQIDFHRYAKQHQIPYVSKTFERIPAFIGKKFIYSHIETGVRNEPIKQALQLLEKASIAKLCYHTSAQKPPLGSEINEKKFKVFFFDIGLMHRILGFNYKNWSKNPGQTSFQGEMAEQLVAQEWMAYSPNHRPSQLFYWHREAKNSNAEVDFIFDINGEIVPIEVKSGATGKMLSMKIYLESHHSSLKGIKISQSPFGQDGKIDFYPLYAMESIY